MPFLGKLAARGDSLREPTGFKAAPESLETSLFRPELPELGFGFRPVTSKVLQLRGTRQFPSDSQQAQEDDQGHRPEEQPPTEILATYQHEHHHYKDDRCDQTEERTALL